FSYGDMTSVAVSPDGSRIAVAIQAENYADNGAAALFSCNEDGSLELLSVARVGVQPDMITFADNNTILTADEGEPRNGVNSTDPKGSVTIVTIGDDNSLTANTVYFDSFDARRGELTAAGVLVQKDTLPSADFEPEYIAVSGNTAYVSLQEANAVAVLDIAVGTFTGVYPLGFRDHGTTKADLQKNDTIDLQYYDNVYGIRMPDGISVTTIGGKTYLLTANEGDSRADWEGLDNEYEDKTSPTGNVTLDKKVVWFNANMWDGLDESKAYVFGGRSFSIYEATENGLTLVYDSGSDFEEITASVLPEYFNASNDKTSLDNRSGKKGPEPESVTVGTACDRTYAFIALERIGGVMVYDITEPENTVFVNYINSREFDDAIKGDVSPEGLCYVSAADSKNGKAMLLTACEVSGTLAVYECDPLHTWSDDWSYDDTYHYHICADCGEKNDIAAHSFDEGVITIQPTEETEGEKTFTCTVCGYTKTVPVAKLDHVHVSDEEYLTDETKHWKICTECGENFEVAAHSFDSGVITTEPTEDSEGVITYTCTVCGHTRNEPVAQLGHVHISTEIYSYDEAVHWKACAGCNEKLEFASHTFDGGVITIQPTEESVGEKVYTCTVCGFTKTETIAMLGHTPSENYSSDAAGHWKICTGCGEQLDFAAHISDNGIVTVQPTEYSNGVKTYSCLVCGYVIKTETIPATENNAPVYTNNPAYVTPVLPAVISEHPCLTLNAAAQNDSITLTWNKIENAKNYTVYRYDNGRYVKVKETDDTSVTFTKLKNGETYTFLVRYTLNGRLSPKGYSGKAEITVCYAPVVKAESDENSVELTWEPVSGAEKYAVYKYADGKAVKLTETKKTAVNIGGLSSDTEYKFIVRAYVNGQWTAMKKSDIVTIKTK
ncbi:MAG: choice-of-anchor I family protein, partial [Oscillospiraceae bacterium]